MKKLKDSRSIRSLFTLFLTSLTALTSSANVVGTDVQNFNPTTSGIDFVTVQSSRTLAPGYMNWGWFLDYSKNTLPYFNNGKKNDSTRYLDLHVGLGLTRNWDIGASLPYLLGQTVHSSTQMASVEDKGFSEYRFNTKYRLSGDDEGGIAVIASVNFNRLENDPFTGDNSGPTYNLELAGDTMIEKLAVAINAGYRFRDPGDANKQITEIKPIKNQYIASIAASYPVTESWNIIGEVFGSRPSQKYAGNTYLQQSSLEWIGSLKYKPVPSVAVYAGGGTKLIDGSATPDWRVFTGMNWTFGPLWGNPKAAPAEEKTMAIEDPQDATVLAEQEEEGGEVTVDPTEFDQPIKEKQTFRLHAILFEFNSDKLKSSSFAFLDKFAAYLKKPPAMKKLVIQGYTDSVGSDAYNIKLSKKRAVSVANYLIKKHKIAAAKIQTQGLGKAHPIADNSTQEGRDKNRRVEFKVTREKK